MRATLILTSLFSALAAAAPVAIDTPASAIEARQSTDFTLQLGNPTTAIQAKIPAGLRVPIASKFSGLGGALVADRAILVGGTGTCTIFSDANAQNRAAFIRRGNEVRFVEKVGLAAGVVVCQAE